MYNYIDETPEYLQEQADEYLDFLDNELPIIVENEYYDRLYEEILLEEMIASDYHQ